MNVPEQVMRGISLGRQGLVEVFLYNLRTKIDEYVQINHFSINKERKFEELN